ncbi:site-specific integrase [Chryseobacterium nematophagum]|uniref:Site-specific integrase n=1 Tax=Chryseobacterium nematophagum TaxID=2305228 RepID=A0A3M7LED7_9FLAO|nr:site-specific integrase [Chryseobacterium nematophagum]RMZ60370.1 site-specific integrase [Chryseobacterium nematophagum]
MSNVNIKIVKGSKPLSDGKFAIYLRIIKNRKKKEIGIGLRCKDNHFESEQFAKQHPNSKIENELILKFKSKAFAIVREYQIDEYDFTLEEFENKFRGEDKQQEVESLKFFDEMIDEMERAGRIGNAKAYKETRDALVRFVGTQLLFSEITPAFLEKFEVFMRARGNQDGGIAFKMKELRAVFNQAIKRKLINRDLYPFDNYKISKLKPKKNKRALTVDDFKKIRDVDLSKRPDLIEAYHYFMFSFYTCGMNFVDMMKLRWTDIQDGRIYYTRSKTKGQFSIEVMDKAEEILNFYKAQNRLTPYVFPILLKEDLSPHQVANRKHKVLRRYNKKLKQISELTGVEKHLTSYVSRHSFATILKQIGTSTDIISELMGHSDVQITATYLKEFDTDVLDQENRKLLNL